MFNKKSNYIFLSIFILIVLIPVVLLYSNSNFSYENLIRRLGINTVPKGSVEITDLVSDKKYHFDTSIHNHSKVVDLIKGTDVDRFEKKVIINSDKKTYGYFLSKGDKLISGYNFKIDYPEETVTIFIYRDPSATDDEFIYYLNKAYVGGLGTAAEANKYDRDNSYVPDAEIVKAAAHEIAVENYDNNRYFITYELK